MVPPSWHNCNTSTKRNLSVVPFLITPTYQSTRPPASLVLAGSYFVPQPPVAGARCLVSCAKLRTECRLCCSKKRRAMWSPDCLLLPPVLHYRYMCCAGPSIRPPPLQAGQRTGRKTTSAATLFRTKGRRIELMALHVCMLTAAGLRWPGVGGPEQRVLHRRRADGRDALLYVCGKRPDRFARTLPCLSSQCPTLPVPIVQAGGKKAGLIEFPDVAWSPLSLFLSVPGLRK